jgi:hypothetical protein
MIGGCFAFAEAAANRMAVQLMSMTFIRDSLEDLGSSQFENRYRYLPVVGSSAICELPDPGPEV